MWRARFPSRVMGCEAARFAELPAAPPPTKAEALVNFGLENRAMAPTLMNTTSSRSHTVLTVHIEQRGVVSDGALSVERRPAGTDSPRAHHRHRRATVRRDSAWHVGRLVLSHIARKAAAGRPRRWVSGSDYLGRSPATLR